MRDSRGRRPPSFYILAAFCGLFILFLYGPLSAIFVLFFQGPLGRLTFPMQGFGTYWFSALLTQLRVGDFAGFQRRSVRPWWTAWPPASKWPKLW